MSVLVALSATVQGVVGVKADRLRYLYEDTRIGHLRQLHLVVAAMTGTDGRIRRAVLERLAVDSQWIDVDPDPHPTRHEGGWDAGGPR